MIQAALNLSIVFLCNSLSSLIFTIYLLLWIEHPSALLYNQCSYCDTSPFHDLFNILEKLIPNIRIIGTSEQKLLRAANVLCASLEGFEVETEEMMMMMTMTMTTGGSFGGLLKKRQRRESWQCLESCLAREWGVNQRREGGMMMMVRMMTMAMIGDYDDDDDKDRWWW